MNSILLHCRGGAVAKKQAVSSPSIPRYYKKHVVSGTPTMPAILYPIHDAANIVGPGRLEGITVPVLLVEGGDSPPVIDAVQSVLAARLPQVTRLIVPGAGHMVPITHPDLVARAVQAHLDAA